MFQISLAEWSLHRTIFAGKLNHLEFASTAKNEFGIEAVEYVNQFFPEMAQDKKYLGDMKSRADDLGVRSLLIMIDHEGRLGDPDDAARQQAVENHFKWVEAAKYLGCHSIRVNASSAGSFEEQQRRAADGLRKLSKFAADFGINVIVENHGGLSSHGKWLVGVIKQVGQPNCGTLPDFGNFRISSENGQEEWYDRYQGVTEMMPYAKAVSAKSHEFDAEGNEVRTDYRRMMDIVISAGYHGYVGIEWEGDEPTDEMEGIRLTQRLLERVREHLANK